MYLTCSLLFGPDGVEKEGVVIQFSDVTQEAELKEKHRNTARGFVIIMGILCLWIFFYAIWELLGRPIQGGVMTMLIEVAAIAGFFCLRRFTTIDFADMGLGTKGIKRALIVDGIATATILAVMLVAKTCIMNFSPDVFGADAKLLDFSRWNIFDTIYPLTVVLQEFLTRGVMHETVRNMIPGKNANAAAIIVSSLFFGALHVHLGLAYMIGSALLLGVFGVIYTKQRTIWGLCIPHYFLGISLKMIFAF